MSKRTDAQFKALHEKMDAQHLEHMTAHNLVNVDRSIPTTVASKAPVKKAVKKATPVKKASPK